MGIDELQLQSCPGVFFPARHIRFRNAPERHPGSSQNRDLSDGSLPSRTLFRGSDRPPGSFPDGSGAGNLAVEIGPRLILPGGQHLCRSGRLAPLEGSGYGPRTHLYPLSPLPAGAHRSRFGQSGSLRGLFRHPRVHDPSPGTNGTPLFDTCRDRRKGRRTPGQEGRHFHLVSTRSGDIYHPVRPHRILPDLYNDPCPEGFPLPGRQQPSPGQRGAMLRGHSEHVFGCLLPSPGEPLTASSLNGIFLFRGSLGTIHRNDGQFGRKLADPDNSDRRASALGGPALRHPENPFPRPARSGRRNGALLCRLAGRGERTDSCL